MSIDFLLDVWCAHEGAEAIIWKDRSYSYRWLRERFEFWQRTIAAEKAKRGTVAILEADFSPDSVALFLALAAHDCILVPLTSSTSTKKSQLVSIAQGEIWFSFDEDDKVRVQHLRRQASHPLYDQLRDKSHPGLVLFSSGSTGEPKAAVHDLSLLLEKFKVRRHRFRTITFLLYDHVGGVNTMLYTLSNAGCMVMVQERSADAVLQAVEKYRVELLPTSPTFLNLILLSEAYRRHDLSSLQTITYGTEPMSETILRRFNELFPQISLRQTYGLSEVGILRSKSSSSASLWMKIGGEGYETRVVDSVLEIKARSAMLGYLNAPSPFSDDGWLNTGDAVEVNGEYLKILGRKSEVINVGGEKVFPTEIESVILELPSVADVTVYAEQNAITGQVVCAIVTPAHELEPAAERDFIAGIKKYCREKLQAYKVPVKIKIVSEGQHTDRFKKVRR